MSKEQWIRHAESVGCCVDDFIEARRVGYDEKECVYIGCDECGMAEQCLAVIGRAGCDK